MPTHYFRNPFDPEPAPRYAPGLSAEAFPTPDFRRDVAPPLVREVDPSLAARETMMSRPQFVPPPEIPTWKKALLTGLGIAGEVGRPGTAASIANMAVMEPERMATQDYARRLEAWQDEQNILTDIRREQEAKRRHQEDMRIREEGQAITREGQAADAAYREQVLNKPIEVSGTAGLYDPTRASWIREPVPPREQPMAQWLYERNVEAQKLFGKPLEQLNPEEAAEVERVIQRANEPWMPYYNPDKMGVGYAPRSEIGDKLAPYTVYHGGVPYTGGVPGASRNQPRAAPNLQKLEFDRMQKENSIRDRMERDIGKLNERYGVAPEFGMVKPMGGPAREREYQEELIKLQQKTQEQIDQLNRYYREEAGEVPASVFGDSEDWDTHGLFPDMR